ncbi:hypothetical protein SLA2020_046060 [Shorea laevis]
MDAIGYHLDLNTVNTLKATPLSIYYHLPDIFSWKGEANGLFSFSTTTLSSDWGWIWESLTLPKIRNFIWLLYHGIIKSMEFLHSLGIVYDPICRICNNFVESLDHIFRGCPLSVSIFNMLLPGILDMDDANISLKDWLKYQAPNMTPSNIHCLPWVVVFCFAIWLIWNNKNHFLYQGRQVNAYASFELIMECAAEFWASQPPHPTCRMKQPFLIA